MKDLWKSKKFKAAVLNTLIGSAALIARSKGYDVSNMEIAAIMTPLTAYILGQGMADWGKEKELKK